MLFTLILRLSAVYNKEGIQNLLRKWLSGQRSASPQLMENNKQPNQCSCDFNDFALKKNRKNKSLSEQNHRSVVACYRILSITVDFYRFVNR